MLLQINHKHNSYCSIMFEKQITLVLNILLRLFIGLPPINPQNKLGFCKNMKIIDKMETQINQHSKYE